MNTSITTPSSENAQPPDWSVDEPHAPPANASWRPLYRTGAAGAALSVAFIAAAVVVFIVWPIPGNVEAWFARYHQNALAGLLDLDLLLVASYIVMIPLYLALYVVLRRFSPSLMALALVADLVGAAVMLAANPAFAMLSLSQRYAAATSEAQRMALLGAGEGLLANWTGTGFDVAYFLGAVAALLIGVVMLRSTVFSKPTAYAALLMGILTLVPASAGVVGIVCSLVSLVPTVVWLILVALRLFQLGQTRAKCLTGWSPTGH